MSDFSRVSKNDTRLVAYADCDEANAAIGVAIALGAPQQQIADVLRQIQNDLFDAGADLSTPIVENPKHPPLRITQDYIDRLETWCDEFNASLPPLKSFVLPGGTALSALLHVARTVSRRAERSAWDAIAQHPSDVSPAAGEISEPAVRLAVHLVPTGQCRQRSAVATRRRAIRLAGRGHVRCCDGARAARDVIPATTGTRSMRLDPTRFRSRPYGPAWRRVALAR